MGNGKKGCLASFFWKVFLPLVVIAIVLIAVVLILATGPAVTYPAPTFDKRDTGVMAGVVTRLARSLVDKEGRVVDAAFKPAGRTPAPDSDHEAGTRGGGGGWIKASACFLCCFLSFETIC